MHADKELGESFFTEFTLINPSAQVNLDGNNIKKNPSHYFGRT